MNRRRVWLWFWGVALAAGAWSSACGKHAAPPPVATVAFASNKTRAPLGSPVVFTYRFTVAPDARIPADYKVFVHVLRDDGNTMWNDDHDPPTPTSQWKPGQTIEYSHTLFIPPYPYLGEANIEVGLYRDNDRLTLAGGDPKAASASSRAYRVGTLQFLPQTENIFIIVGSGWQQPEGTSDPNQTFQWIQKAATCSFQNPHKDVTFYLEYDARVDVFPDKPQQVTIFSGDTQVDSFPADSGARTIRKVPITSAQLGTGDMAELRIELDRTFVPAKLPGGGRDPRELGIRVYNRYVEVR